MVGAFKADPDIKRFMKNNNNKRSSQVNSISSFTTFGLMDVKSLFMSNYNLNPRFVSNNNNNNNNNSRKSRLTASWRITTRQEEVSHFHVLHQHVWDSKS